MLLFLFDYVLFLRSVRIYLIESSPLTHGQTGKNEAFSLSDIVWPKHVVIFLRYIHDVSN